MQKNVLEYLEHAGERWPARALYKDEARSITHGEALDTARRLGEALCARVRPGQPVVVFAPKLVETPLLFFAILYAGGFYVPLDATQPVPRLAGIFNLVRPALVLSPCADDKAVLEKLGYSSAFVDYDTLLAQAPAEGAPCPEAGRRLAASLDTDPACVIFTSGSSGVPKGVLLPQRALVDYIDVFADTFALGEDRVYGSQAPPDYVAGIRDLYLPLATGGRTVFLPTKLFTMPALLFGRLNEEDINTLCWVSPALSLCSEMGVFKTRRLDKVDKVFFTGSTFSSPQLRRWQEHLPQATFVNHYGPTEITASCTYYVVDHLVEPDETLPVGVPFRNTGIVLLREDGTEAAPGQRGEICVKGSCLALGYYKNPERTAEAFIENPLQGIYAERLYKTGDIGSLREDGVLLFHGRRDFQIKHMGHRIELSEIETAAAACPGIGACACLYKPERMQIWLFYTGMAEPAEVSKFLWERLPPFMVPRQIHLLDAMPLTPSGKPDLRLLQEKMG